MNKLRHINDFTIREYELYVELLEAEDIFGLFNLFGLEADKLNVTEFKKAFSIIQSQTLSMNVVKRRYKIKGRTFNAALNIPKLKAAQFIDLQQITQSGNKLEDILSVVLIPKGKKYNTGYDVLEVRKFLYENFTIGEAHELSNFFLTQSLDLLKVTKDYLVKKKMKLEQKGISSHGSKFARILQKFKK